MTKLPKDELAITYHHGVDLGVQVLQGSKPGSGRVSFFVNLISPCPLIICAVGGHQEVRVNEV